MADSLTYRLPVCMSIDPLNSHANIAFHLICKKTLDFGNKFKQEDEQLERHTGKCPKPTGDKAMH